MQRVFVLSSTKQPLMPCHPARARELLKKGRAAVFRHYPFTIILKNRAEGDVQATQFKVDPGAKTTGLALVADCKRGLRCIWAAELTHRGWQIKAKLASRRVIRRSRRSRKTRYRQPRFLNRTRPTGWLPPSLQSRVDNIWTWLNRLNRFVPLTHLAMELVRFDTQKLQDPEISGIEYQQGELMGYELREYLLEKWARKCAYCGAVHVRLEVEHLVPKSRGGGHRVSNLCIACHDCNQKKGQQTAAEFGFPHLQAQAKKPLKGAAVVNTTRWALFDRLKTAELPLEVGTGGRTKFNRVQQGYPKTHWLDAMCVGESGRSVFVSETMQPLHIQAVGRQSRQMCRVDRFGFPRTAAKQKRQVNRFETGDIVKAMVTTGKKAGMYIGRVAVRTSGFFNISTRAGTVQGISYRCCTLLHKNNGYHYEKGEAAFSTR